MRLVVARCTVDYRGRLDAHLPEAVRLIMVKADGCVAIHADGGAYKPLNWMNAPNTLVDHGEHWTVTNPKGEELTITLLEVVHDTAHEFGDDPGLQKDGVEAHLQELLAASPHAIEDGLTLVRRDYPTAIGPIDLVCRDTAGQVVAIEVKRRGEIGGVEQLARYIERLHLDSSLGQVRGVFVAQVVKPQAKVLAEARGFSVVEVDYDELRGMKPDELRLLLTMHRIHGVAQHYAWGDRSAIPTLLGVPVDGSPSAEWWVGTHPGGPSSIDDGRSLREASGELPYLVKLLAAAEALSLQTHPDEATARDGFARESAAGIAIDDPRRIYRDSQADPELLCAITEFDALCGFRPVADTVALLRTIGVTSLAEALASEGLERTVAALYRGAIALAPILDACDAADREEAVLVNRLAKQYPNEASVVVTLLLHRVHLRPNEALYLGPGNLHAYLHGFGLEVMGASDNVVRGGLTPKHVDVDELLRVLSYEPMLDPIVRAQQRDDGRWHYPTPLAPFELSRHEVEHTLSYRAERNGVLICTAGDALRGTRAAWLSAGDVVELVGPSTVFAIARA